MNTMLNELGQKVRLAEANTAAEVFVDIARFLVAGADTIGGAVQMAEARGRERAAAILKNPGVFGNPGAARQMKSPVSAGSTTDPSWAAPLANYEAVAAAWLGSLRSISAFDRLLPDMINVPLRTNIGITTVGASAYVVGEGQVKTLSQLSIDVAGLAEKKAVAWLVITTTLAKLAGSTGSRLFDSELRAAVAAVVDEEFIRLITAGLTPISSAGSTVVAVRSDLAAALAEIATNARSKLFVLTTSKIAKAWALSNLDSGAAAFPGMGVGGGEIAGMPVVVSFGVPDGQVVVVDASGIAANGATIGLEMLRHASVEMAAPPDSPSTATTVLRNLWQNNMVALAATRWFGAQRVRDTAVALVENVSYSGDSPA